jgi:hypothetical protein
MKKLAVIALMIGIGAVPALAQTDFNFTFSDSQYTLSGVFVATPDGGGVYTATSVIDGTLTYLGQTFDLTLVPVGNDARDSGGPDFFGQDNLLYPNSPTQLLTTDSLIFQATARGLGTSNVYIWANGSSDYGIETSWILAGAPLGTPGWVTGSSLYTGGTSTLSAVPDGGTTLLLLGLAVAGLAGLRRKLSV